MQKPIVKTTVTPVISLLSRGLSLVPMEAPAAPAAHVSYPYGKQAVTGQVDVWAGR